MSYDDDDMVPLRCLSGEKIVYQPYELNSKTETEMYMVICKR